MELQALLTSVGYRNGIEGFGVMRNIFCTTTEVFQNVIFPGALKRCLGLTRAVVKSRQVHEAGFSTLTLTGKAVPARSCWEITASAKVKRSRLARKSFMLR